MFFVIVVLEAYGKQQCCSSDGNDCKNTHTFANYAKIIF